MAIKKMFKPQKTALEPRFAKAQFLTSSRYAGAQKDALSIVLEEGQRYTAEEAERKIQEFNTRRVN